MGDAAVSTAGPVGRTEGPTPVASLRPYRPWIGGAGRHGGRQARVRSHRPWSGAARGAWPQAVTRAGADEGQAKRKGVGPTCVPRYEPWVRAPP